MIKHEQVEEQAVLTVPEVRKLLRASSDEYTRYWLKTYAPDAILPGGRIRVSRAALMAVIDRGANHHPQVDPSRSGSGR